MCQKHFFVFVLLTAVNILEIFSEHDKCPGRCVEVTKCPFFASLLSGYGVPRPRHVVREIWRHNCGIANENRPKVCCPEETIGIHKEPPNVTDHENLKLLPLDTCGPIVNDYRITSGSETLPMEFPWMALIAYVTDGRIDFRCGGTLINDRYVLTAAHCMKNTTFAGVRLGEHNIKTVKDCNSIKGTCAPPVLDFYIEDVIIHPEYQPSNFKNDIALIRLATPANFSYENIQPICLPIGEQAKFDLDDTSAVISGWGVTETGYKSSQLLKTSVPVMSNQECNRIYENRSDISYKQLCAGGYMGRDSCGGDSGGPLKYIRQFNGRSRFVQHGIVSYGPRHCGTEGQPGVYTRLVYYMDWILDNLKPD